MTTEFYTTNSPVQYWSGTPHTDTISYIGSTVPDGVEIEDCLYDSIMDMQEYNETILANCSEVEDDSDMQVRVIVLPNNYAEIVEKRYVMAQLDNLGVDYYEGDTIEELSILLQGQ